MNNSKLPLVVRVLDAGLKLAAWGFFAIGLVCFLLVFLMMWNGDVWARILYAEKPVHNFASGLGAMSLWYFLLYGINNTARQWLSFCGRVFLVAFSVCLCLAAGEIAIRKIGAARQAANSMESFKAARLNGKPMPIRSTHPLAYIVQPSDNQKLVYELQPNMDMMFGHRRVITNQEGMRKSRDYPVARSPHSIRIMGIGDSGMFGWDVEQGENYVDMLETNLNKRADGILYEVIELAVPGYNTQLELEMLRYRGLKYKPDIVIVGWCENDFSLPFFMMEKENYWRKDVSYLYKMIFKRNKSRTVVAPGFVIRDLREFDEKNVMPELLTGTEIAGVKGALAELKKMGEQSGFKVLVMGPMRETICRICKEVGLPYMNTHERISADKYPADWLVHFMHPRAEGHRVIAEYLEKDLAQRGWLTPKD